jgi:hypothetical protein
MTENQQPGSSMKATMSEAGNQAGELADQTARAGQHLAGTAKESAAQVVVEVKEQATGVLSMARTSLADQVSTQQQKAAQGLHAIAGQLSGMADSGTSGLAGNVVRRAADRTTSAAAWLESGDPASLLNDVATFARRRPSAFLALATGAGVAVGRLSRGLAAGAVGGPRPTAHRAAGSPVGGSSSGTARHARTSPAAAGTSGADDPFLHEPTLPAGLPPVSVDMLPPGPAGAVPPTDPFSTGRH